MKAPKTLAPSIAALALLIASPAAAAECRASPVQLNGAVREVHDKQKNIGAQAAIWLDGRIVWSEGFGLADLETERPVTPKTPFAIASIAKGVTGLAYLKAEAAGLIDPTAPIQRYVPEFKVKGAEAVTPRRLLAHHAGLPHWEGTPAERAPLYAMHFDNVAELTPLWREMALKGKPGDEFLYSSPGYNVLALAIQRATRTEFRAYVRREVLQPLGLAHTRFDDARRRPAETAVRYTWKDPFLYYYLKAPERVPDWDYSHNFAGGNMLSTAEDMVRLGAALQRPGYLSQAQLARIATRPTLSDGTATSFSYGWSVSKPGTEPLVSMTGSNAGVQAGLFSYPERKLAVSVLANTWGVGSESGELVFDLPKRLAELCAPAG